MNPICNNVPNTQPMNMLNNEEYNKNKYAHIVNIEKEPALLEYNKNKYAYIVNKQDMKIQVPRTSWIASMRGTLRVKRTRR